MILSSLAKFEKAVSRESDAWIVFLAKNSSGYVRSNRENSIPDQSYDIVLILTDSQTLLLVPKLSTFDCGGAASSVTFDLSQASRLAEVEFCDLWNQNIVRESIDFMSLVSTALLVVLAARQPASHYCVESKVLPCFSNNYSRSPCPRPMGRTPPCLRSFGGSGHPPNS